MSKIATQREQLSRPIPSRSGPSLRRGRRAQIQSDDDREWLDRSKHWIADTKPTASVRRRTRSPQPLFLGGYGVSLNVDRGTLFIRDGFTHYPQQRTEHRIFPGDPTRPTRIVVVDGPGSLTFDVIDWLREQSIDLVRISWDGKAVCLLGGSGLSANADKFSWQLRARDDVKLRMAFSTRLIRDKLSASVETLRSCFPGSEASAQAMAITLASLKGLARRTPATMTELRGIEAKTAAAYFRAWNGLQLEWKGERRHPIPSSWKTYAGRTSLLSGKIAKRDRATHPLNAMLNYGYAVLEAELRIRAIAEGYDPTLGIMHRGYGRNAAFVFDLMEPLRPVVDGALLGFAMAETFTGADFVLRSDGVCRLNPQLARRVAQIASEAMSASTVQRVC